MFVALAYLHRSIDTVSDTTVAACTFLQGRQTKICNYALHTITRGQSMQ